MPRGPLGLKRATSLGPFVETDTNELPTNPPTVQELKDRTHSWREYDPAEFEALLLQGASSREINEALNSMERSRSGSRFTPMLDETHKFFRALDADERKEFWDKNPNLMRWTTIWAASQDLMTFPKYRERKGLPDIGLGARPD